MEFTGRMLRAAWAEDEQSGGGLNQVIISDLGTLQSGALSSSDLYPLLAWHRAQHTGDSW